MPPNIQHDKSKAYIRYLQDTFDATEEAGTIPVPGQDERIGPVVLFNLRYLEQLHIHGLLFDSQPRSKPVQHIFSHRKDFYSEDKIAFGKRNTTRKNLATLKNLPNYSSDLRH